MSNHISDTYRRLLVDMHIPDWDPSFLAEFDPDHFLDAVAGANVATVTVPSNGHTGLCYWPSAVGRSHANAPKLLGTLIDGAHARGLNVVVYYCTIYVEQYWDDHPEARMVDAKGESRRVVVEAYPFASRFRLCCPNDEGYRRFCVTQLKELCSELHFEGVNLDMMFWPMVCYCPNCELKYREATGLAIPRIVDWADPSWVRFARLRQRWLKEFISLLASTLKSEKPQLAVTHQSGMYTLDWVLGASIDIATDTDWLSADLYRTREQLSFYFKLFYGLSETKPFEEISTWCYPSIHEHVIQRTPEELEALASLAVSNDAAIVFLEQIDPPGRINDAAYPVIGRINDKIRQIEPDLGGLPCRDVGIYYSFESTFDLAHGARPVTDFPFAFEPGRPVETLAAHFLAAKGAANALLENHIPFGVLTKKDLASLSDWQVIILPNVVCLGDDEIEALRSFVERGGGLYASRDTSLLSPEGFERPNFGLSDLFGADRIGETVEGVTYMSPTDIGGPALGSFTRLRPLTIHGPQTMTRRGSNVEVLAELALPYTDPLGERYASVITDPPGRWTEAPALTAKKVGAGRVVYCSGALESEEHESQRRVFAGLVRDLAVKSISFSADAPKCVEITLYDQPDRNRLVAHFVNFQDRLPNIPVNGLRFRLAERGRRFRRLTVLGSEAVLDWESLDGVTEVLVPTFETMLSLRFEY